MGEGVWYDYSYSRVVKPKELRGNTTDLGAKPLLLL
jgi:hypothetical protein